MSGLFSFLLPSDYSDLDEPIEYKAGDIVWVKLSPFWWPGEVTNREEVPDDITDYLKKEPLAFVKFFDEDLYECVKSYNSIRPYHSSRKKDFIKKGMDAFRRNNAKLKNFPRDITTAEIKTNGDINILSDPMFADPKQKTGEISNSASKAKQTRRRTSTRSSRGRGGPRQPLITHRRFLGYDDYQAHILLQEEPINCGIPENDLEQDFYTCPICGYQLNKLSLISAHIKYYHVSSRDADGNAIIINRGVPPGLVELDSGKKPRKNRTKKKVIKPPMHQELSSDEDDIPLLIRKSAELPPEPSLPVISNHQPSNTKHDLLADWENDIDENINDVQVAAIPQESRKTSSEQKPTAVGKKPEKEKDAKSCFDFEEEEEERPNILNSTTGRKIPRVIPISEKRKSFTLSPMSDDESGEQSQPNSTKENNLNETNESEDFDKSFREIMETTKRPQLPDIPNKLKSEQNFHYVSTVKTPDKLDKDLEDAGDTASNDSNLVKLMEAIMGPPSQNSPTILSGMSKFRDSDLKERDRHITEKQATDELIRSLEDSRTPVNTPKSEIEDALPKLEENSQEKETDKLENSEPFDLLADKPLEESGIDSQNEKLHSQGSENPVGELIVEEKTMKSNLKAFKKQDASLKVSVPLGSEIMSSLLKSPSKLRRTSRLSSSSDGSKEIDLTSNKEKQKKTGVFTDLQAEGYSILQKYLEDKPQEESSSEKLPSVPDESSLIRNKESNEDHLKYDTKTNLPSKDFGGTSKKVLQKPRTPKGKKKQQCKKSRTKLQPKLATQRTTGSKQAALVGTPEKDQPPNPTDQSVEDVGEKSVTDKFDAMLADSQKYESLHEMIFYTKKPKSIDDSGISLDKFDSSHNLKDCKKKCETSANDLIEKSEKTFSLVENACGTTNEANPLLENQNIAKLIIDNQSDNVSNETKIEQKDQETLDVCEKKLNEEFPILEDKVSEILTKKTNDAKDDPTAVSDKIELLKTATLPSNDKILSLPHSTQFPNLLGRFQDSKLGRESCLKSSPKIDLLDNIFSNDGQESLDATELTNDDVTNIDSFEKANLSTSESSNSSVEKLKDATKLINPKKRFVKTFENFELLQSEQKRKAEETKSPEHVLDTKKQDIDVTASHSYKPKTQLIAKVKSDDLKKPDSPKADSPDSKENDLISLQQMLEDDSESVCYDAEISQPIPENKEIDPKTDTFSKFSKAFRSPIEKDKLSRKPTSQELENNSVDSNDFKPSHELHIKFSSEEDSSDFNILSIKTNLTNFDNNDLATLTKLSTVSEIKSLNIDSKNIIKQTSGKTSGTDNKESFLETAIPVDGNLTVVSEKELAEGQVEITASMPRKRKKPTTLTTFSMDFSDESDDEKSDTKKKSPVKKKSRNLSTDELPSSVVDKTGVATAKTESEDSKPIIFYNTGTTSNIPELCDLEEHIPSQIVCTKDAILNKERLPETCDKSSKLLNILTSDKQKEVNLNSKIYKLPDCTQANKAPGKNTKVIVKTIRRSKPQTASGIRPSMKTTSIPSKEPVITNTNTSISNSEISISNKTTMGKIEGKSVSKVSEKTIFVKPSTSSFGTAPGLSKSIPTLSKNNAGKAKILNQTIIKPSGEIYQPKIASAISDDTEFDINSMPIVLSDELFSPETLDNIPVVLSENSQATTAVPTQTTSYVIDKKASTKQTPVKLLNKTFPTSSLSETKTPIKTASPKTTLQKPLKHTAPSGNPIGKVGKYLIVPQVPKPTPSLPKKPVAVRRPTPLAASSKLQSVSPEVTGNKIMIVTNQQGQQQRVLLTPSQQKLLEMQGAKAPKTAVKSNLLQKVVSSRVSSPTTSTPTLKNIPKTTAVNQQMHLTTPVRTPAMKKMQKPGPNLSGKPPQKTILIKNQHGQTVRKIQGTSDALLEKQVAEQLEAIKASGLKASQEMKMSKPVAKRKSIPMKMQQTSMTQAIPPLSPISKKTTSRPSLPSTSRLSTALNSSVTSNLIAKTSSSGLIEMKKAIESKVESTVSTEMKPPDRLVNQLVIQDGQGNQTTITEGQILALPSETIDGQPQSYVLVTLDESGNLTPLNNEALMSLDPSLGLSDLNNMVLQIDQSAGNALAQPSTLSTSTDPAVFSNRSKGSSEPLLKTVDTSNNINLESSLNSKPMPSHSVVPDLASPQQMQIACNLNSDTGQQLIVTGDSAATQKFLATLTEGNPELASILANAEGQSFLIQADGQQILVNPDADNQLLLSLNPNNLNLCESAEGSGNPMFASHSTKSQDILAAALEATDVFQPDQLTTSKIMQSQLSPSSSLFQINVGNVLETSSTSLTLNNPIMSPLEIHSTNSKKIPDEEANLITQVPSNANLPITITDPNISQTVSQQVLVPTNLTTSLEISLPISNGTLPLNTPDISSPNFVYPTLDVNESDVTSKAFGGSMPLLSVENNQGGKKGIESQSSSSLVDSLSFKLDIEQGDHGSGENKRSLITTDGSFIDEGLCTLGGEMCSSLSEPPPEMFDIPLTKESNCGNSSILPILGSPSNRNDGTTETHPELETTLDSNNQQKRSSSTAHLSDSESKKGKFV